MLVLVLRWMRVYSAANHCVGVRIRVCSAAWMLIQHVGVSMLIQYVRVRMRFFVLRMLNHHVGVRIRVVGAPYFFIFFLLTTTTKWD